MPNKPTRLNRYLAKGLISIVVAAFGLQFAPPEAMGQTKANSFLANFSAKRSIVLRASFVCSPVFPVAGQPVQFKDVSTGNPASWQWDFGDGTGSIEENPTHVYPAAGFRRVTLVVANGNVSRKVSRALAVMPSQLAASFVFSPTTPGPGQTVQFADTSSGSPTAWSWNFGDGSSSGVKNPSHAFLKAGSYMVSLVATCSTGSKQASKTVMVASMSVLTSSFAFIPTAPTVGQTVQFTDASTGSPTAWAWSFGDGATSSARNPTHAYTTAGVKTVSLAVTDNAGTNTSTQSLTVAAALTASFTFSPTSPVTGQSLQFTDMSSGNPASWSWNFGDGSTSSAQNPNHAYTTAGTKTVTLTVTNGSGTNSASRTVTVTAPLKASFSFSPSSPVVSQSVQFTDTSTGSPSIWQWNFGDGSTSSTQNPSHAYTTAGSFTVTLTVMNASSQNAGTQTLTVSAASTLAASFTFNPASPSAGQAVQFSDTSTGGPTSWSWTFGDGATSTAQNPSHTYATAGSRTVTLTATNGSGSSNVSKTVTVAVALAASFNFSPASPAAGQAVQFTDTSTGSPTSWSWTFGDGATSTAQNPSHTYATAGSRTVALTATNGSGSTSVSKTVTVTAGLTASFTFGPSSPTAGQAVQFTDTSTGSPTSWSWDFNDGTTSTAQNPSHAFSTAGSYSVTLVAANSSTSKSVTQVVAVASASTLTASFRFSPASPTPNQAVQFTDTSSGSPVSWSWNFGDGASSAVQNPSHAYASVGSKTVTLTVTGSSGSSSASQTISVATESTIIPADRRIDWTYCGVPGGIPARTTISTTLNPGATASQINAAIAACPSGQVVYLSAGTYNNMGAIHFASKSGVTLRGAGAGQTIINSNVAGGGSYCIDSDYWGFSGATAISSGYVKGSTSLTMSATPTNFAVGKLIMIYQDDDITLVMGTDGPQTGINSNLKTIHRITNKVGSVLTIEPPLPYTLTAGLHPSAMYCAGTPTTLCGIEDLTLNAQAANYASILWANADRCWVKGVECYNADNIFVFPYEALQFEMRRSYCHFSGNFPNSQEGYGVYLYAASTYCRVEDNIFYQLIAGMLQSMSSCNAFLYNYGWQSCFLNQPYQFCMIDCNHGPHTMMCLWEGNMAEQFQNDGYHGSGSHQTLFRNWFHGLHPVWTDNRKMIDLCRAAYYHNIVGNVLGASSWTPANYEAGVGATNTIYRFGFPNMTNESTSPEVPWSSAYGLSYPDARVKSTLLRHGNYDYFNKAAVWDPNISDHSLPASLLYTSKPSYFGSLQWPPIGPDVPGFVTNIPAKARWDAYQASGNKSDLF